MALRLIEVFLDESQAVPVRDALKAHQVLGVWTERLGEGQLLVRALLAGENTEAALDALSQRFSGERDFRVVLLPVEASLPRPDAPPDPTPPADTATEKPRSRLSRDELYDDVNEAIRLSPVFEVLAALSTVVAAIGLWKGNVAVVIGAMVIAPLLGPNVGLALATTLGDAALARRALKTNGAGLLTAFLLSLALGKLLAVTPTLPEVATRTQVSLSDLALALAAGVAGALSLTSGISTALIGVMVAVALLPPLATFGMLLGAGFWQDALGALLLLVTNVICVNLAGVVTFWAQGIRPATWWEADRARRATRRALAAWFLLLIALAWVIHLAQRR